MDFTDEADSDLAPVVAPTTQKGDVMPEVALITVHGMGQTPRDYAAPLFDKVRDRLGDLRGGLDCGAVYYQDLLQDNESKIWEDTRREGKVHYEDLRKFLLFGFGDAAGLENRKEDDGSVYEKAQGRIARQLLAAYEAGRGKRPMPVMFLSHSLGCQVLSSYIYDAQRALEADAPQPQAGIWKNIDGWSLAEPGIERALTLDEKSYIAAEQCMAWITTGCNIPIFVAAHDEMKIRPIRRPKVGNFRWLNIYDPDDALGWPLQPLKCGYETLVEDRAINAGQGMINWLLKSWNPMSHTLYWDDDDVLDPLTHMLRLLIA
jgi:hypothetical protein